MGKIKLHVANANIKFTNAEVDIIQNATKTAEKFISDNFNFDYEVDLIVTSPSLLMNTIPEDGISGRTYNSQLIILVLDRQQKEITEEFVYETICHEMSHSLRWEKLPEYAKTLFDGMILEGLAVTLEEEAVSKMENDRKQSFLKEIQNTSQTMIDDILIQISSTLKNKWYDYNEIFYASNDTLPRWTGYRLGYYFVQKHIKKTGTTILDATLASYSQFDSKI